MGGRVSVQAHLHGRGRGGRRGAEGRRCFTTKQAGNERKQVGKREKLYLFLRECALFCKKVAILLMKSRTFEIKLLSLCSIKHISPFHLPRCGVNIACVVGLRPDASPQSIFDLLNGCAFPPWGAERGSMGVIARSQGPQRRANRVGDGAVGGCRFFISRRGGDVRHDFGSEISLFCRKIAPLHDICFASGLRFWLLVLKTGYFKIYFFRQSVCLIRESSYICSIILKLQCEVCNSTQI